MLTRSHRAVMQLSALGVGAMLLLTGCDFWPPALQAQIEQLHSEAQQSAADKALLQNQLNAANKAKEELQIRVEDLTRVNKEKSVMIANLAHDRGGQRARGEGREESRRQAYRESRCEETPQGRSQSNGEIFRQVDQRQESKTRSN